MSLCGKRSFPSLFPSVVLCSPGTFPPSNLIPLQRHLLHLTTPIRRLLAHCRFGFMSWMSSFSFLQPSAISKNQVHAASPTSSLHPCPHRVEQKVVVISGPLRPNDRSCAAPAECNVLFWKEHEHGEAATPPSPPAERGCESLYLYSVLFRDLS